MYTIEIRHNVESAHRFYQATSSPKCRHIHGHSWMITLALSAHTLNQDGMVIEFGQIKRLWRTWLDHHLDHTLMLHQDDPMVSAIQSVEADARLYLLPQDPTTEYLAAYLLQQAQTLLSKIAGGDRIQIESVHVQETHVNAATYSP